MTRPETFDFSWTPLEYWRNKKKLRFLNFSKTRFCESWGELILELFPTIWTYQNPTNMNFRLVLCNFRVWWGVVGVQVGNPPCDICCSHAILCRGGGRGGGDRAYIWALVSEPGFLDFQIFIFLMFEIFCCCKMCLTNMVVEYRGIKNKGLRHSTFLGPPWNIDKIRRN